MFMFAPKTTISISAKQVKSRDKHKSMQRAKKEIFIGQKERNKNVSRKFRETYFRS